MRVLLDVAAGGRADASLERRARGLTGADRALAQEIAFGTLRWKLLLDDRLDALLTEGLGSLPAVAGAVLEAAAYQLLFLDRVPAYAVIDEAVEQARALLPPAQARGLTGVVNATLRRLASHVRDTGGSASGPLRDVDGILPGQAPGADAVSPESAGAVARLSVATSHPAWLVQRWVERFGMRLARAILDGDNRRPGLHLRPHAGRTSAQELVERLRAEGADCRLHPLWPGCVVLERGDPAALGAYREGLFAVQDVSAQLVASLAVESSGPLSVDLCAAPGGKAGAMAEATPGRMVLAVDSSRSRLARLLENARRQGLGLHAVVGDARTLAFARPADFALADVPCLGTGTLRRRVDARWSKTPELLPELVELQRAILSNAAELLAPGGRLMYATCSLEREENEEAVAWLLARRPDLRLVDLSSRLSEELRTPIPEAAGSALLVTPAAGDCDGAFAALLQKAA